MYTSTFVLRDQRQRMVSKTHLLVRCTQPRAMNVYRHRWLLTCARARLFQADCHPGNILVRENGTVGARLQDHFGFRATPGLLSAEQLGYMRCGACALIVAMHGGREEVFREDWFGLSCFFFWHPGWC